MLIKLQNVTTRVGQSRVLDNIDLTIYAGEIVTVIGPNGAGKSTLVRVVLGLLTPDEGHVERSDSTIVGYVPQNMVVDSFMPMPVLEFLRTAGQSAQSAIARTLDDVGALQVLSSPLGKISGGELRRVLLARALLRKPDLLVLDEPAAGLSLIHI